MNGAICADHHQSGFRTEERSGEHCWGKDESLAAPAALPTPCRSRVPLHSEISHDEGDRCKPNDWLGARNFDQRRWRDAWRPSFGLGDHERRFLAPPAGPLCLGEQFSNGHVQRGCQDLDCIQRRIRAPSLDARHVRAGETAKICELVLLQTSGEPQIADAVTEHKTQGLHRPCIVCK